MHALGESNARRENLAIGQALQHLEGNTLSIIGLLSTRAICIVWIRGRCSP